MTPKRINFNSDTKTFQANGVTYYIEYKLCKLRYVEKEKLEPIIRFGSTLEELQKQFSDMYAMGQTGTSQMKFNHFVIETAANNLDIEERFMSGKNLEAVLDYCCLFCNRENEDIREFDTRLNEQKKKDWQKEGIAVLDFFFLCWLGLGNSAKDFLEMIQKNQSQAKSLLEGLTFPLKTKETEKDLKQSIPKT